MMTEVKELQTEVVFNFPVMGKNPAFTSEVIYFDKCPYKRDQVIYFAQPVTEGSEGVKHWYVRGQYFLITDLKVIHCLDGERALMQIKCRLYHIPNFNLDH
ncbi:MAG: hypothetical protein F6K53_20150 [Moorea sp. SIO4A1]|uniref:hypothetical protein n=1 Tax=Moorena sp. SIO4A1 TaxID=2607835 RepID=UPI0014181AFE|nr:hypothetical protein [Moorena sp. SIO4A1]NEO43286.1 hypothetical protein [Moorena sp. SIO4A3]NEQ59584.1 hypothetical protein [Moorena sp. SIO4A1]